MTGSVCCVHSWGLKELQQWSSSRFSLTTGPIVICTSVNYKFLWMWRGQCVVYTGVLRNHNSPHQVVSARQYCYLYKFCTGSRGCDGVSVLCTQVLFETRKGNLEPFQLDNIVTCTSVKCKFLWQWRGQCVVYTRALRNQNSGHRVVSARGYCYL